LLGPRLPNPRGLQRHRPRPARGALLHGVWVVCRRTCVLGVIDDALQLPDWTVGGELIEAGLGRRWLGAGGHPEPLAQRVDTAMQVTPVC
jgi:hypothetical protein